MNRKFRRYTHRSLPAGDEETGKRKRKRNSSEGGARIGGRKSLENLAACCETSFGPARGLLLFVSFRNLPTVLRGNEGSTLSPEGTFETKGHLRGKFDVFPFSIEHGHKEPWRSGHSGEHNIRALLAAIQ